MHDVHSGEAAHAHSAHEGLNRLAASATTHCLTGCVIGEVTGMVVGTAIGLGDVATMVLAIVLAFTFGYTLTAYPLVKVQLGATPPSAILPRYDTPRGHI